jgi:N-acetylglucosaminyldiphosphoundecaprenol N-acetyl-beta-D-mannosaminyltransferase
LRVKDSFYLLGVRIDPLTLSGALAVLEERIAKRRQTFVITVNPELIMLCRRDEQVRRAAAAADFVFPDGIGVVWAGRYLGYKVPERVTGLDLTEKLLARAGACGYKIFLLGGAPGVAQQTIANSLFRYPSLSFVGCQHGFFTEEEMPTIIANINKAAPDILLVALGMPKQENWIFTYRRILKSCVIMGVGGAFDVIAGKARRAPPFMQKAGLEWLYRLLKEPARFSRMLAIPKFIFCVLVRGKTNCRAR